MPQRVTRTRKSGESTAKGAVYVGRPTCWGNPFAARDVNDAAAEFRRWLLDPERTDHADRKRRILRSIRQLAGRDLACWCATGTPCHADVLLELANRPRQVMQTTPTNCFAACVATLLDVPIESVPLACDARFWDFDAFQRWLAAEFAMQAIEVVLGPASIVPVQHSVPCILTGESPRRCMSGLHAVVGQFCREGFELTHDPHASGEGIQDAAVRVTFFVKTAPALE